MITIFASLNIFNALDITTYSLSQHDKNVVIKQIGIGANASQEAICNQRMADSIKHMRIFQLQAFEREAKERKDQEVKSEKLSSTDYKKGFLNSAK